MRLLREEVRELPGRHLLARGKGLGLWLVATAIVVATVLLLSTNTIHGHPAGTAGHQRARTLATVRYQGAGPSCVNVWMGGNPDDPRACRPAPSP